MVKFSRIKGISQESVATKTAVEASRLIEEGFEIISITQYADANSLGRNKAATIYYK
ncbi:hypothetical protein MYMA111404_02655 [Mycoplasma marinum]|uniref:hypothetical protein n=1 Tax=Mycoplasma marinum TaxID=1937190 RepID=UPI0014444E61|nr:hypothetical protein [Mycoplasma marinum]